MSNKDYQPEFNVYTVSGEGKNSYWTRIGAAFAHRDGKKGFNIVLSALPLDNKLVLIDYEEDQQRREDAKDKNQAA
ncbi:MAG: hypothetical protein JJ964_08290 [Rhizobiales bacterium]|nr:hypothetical protein [Hyphomicrobiales bacterium]